jgi:hypothetical protein
MVSFRKHIILAFCIFLLNDMLAQNVPWVTPATSLNAVPLMINCLPRVNGQILVAGDYIGVFNSAGKCFGLARWKDTINFSVTVYGYDGSVDGFRNGDSISVRVWIKNENCILDRISQLSTDNPLIFSNTVSNRINILNYEKLAVAFPEESYCMNEGMIAPELNYTVNDLSFLAAADLDIHNKTGIINPLNSLPGTYSIELKSGICMTSKNLTITLNDYPHLQNMPDTFICGDTPLVITLTNNYEAVQWSTGAVTPQVNLTEPVPVWYRVTNETGCSNADTFNVKRTSIKALDYSIDKADCYHKGRVTIHDLEIENGKTPYTYQLTSQLENIEILELSEVPEGIYNIEVLNANGCKLRHLPKVIVEKDCLNDIPVFSPNDDGMDDRYFISLEGKVQIFDRNGSLKRRLMAPCYFDGNDETGRPLPMGTYLVVPEKGSNVTLTIIR